MALPEQTLQVVETKLGAYCYKKVPAGYHGQVRLTFSVLGSTVTVFEEKTAQNNLDKRTKLPLAQFRLNVVDHLWHLYCPSQKRQEGWVLYPGSKPTDDFEVLLVALDQDTAGAIWG